MNSRTFGYDHGQIRSIASDFIENPKHATDLQKILNDHNIHVREHTIGLDINNKPIWGACRSNGLKRLIVVSPLIEHNTRKRFTIAHELGHIFLRHGNHECVSTDFDSWRDKLIVENEANTFAAELLLPYWEIKAALGSQDVSFDLVDILAKNYETSLAATAIRLVKLDEGMSIVIYHDGKKANWSIPSPDCREDLQVPISSKSLYAKARQINGTVKEYVDPSIWFTGYVDDWVCFEETRYLQPVNMFYTLINIYEQ